MKKKTNIIIYSSLGVVLVGLLASSLTVYFLNKRYQESYSLPYDDYQRISDLDDLYGDIAEKAGVDLGDFNILNHSQIDLNDGGAIDDLDVSCFYIKEAKAYGIGLERSGDSYCVSISRLDDVPTGDAARLSLAVGAASVYSEASMADNVMVTFMDEAVGKVGAGSSIYDGESIESSESETLGSFTPIEFFGKTSEQISPLGTVYIERAAL